MTDHRDSWTSIQRDCTDLGAAEPEFSMNELYGLRQWNLRPHPETGQLRLVGHRGHVWDPTGPNIATCTKKNEYVTHHFIVTAAEVYASELTFEEIVAGRTLELLEQHSTVASVTISPGLYAGRSVIATPEMLAAPRDADWGWNIKLLDPETLGVGARGELKRDSLRVGVTVNTLVTPHAIAHPTCTCGFYAYTDRASIYQNSHSSPMAMFGLVRLYGHVTQGTRGLRAERAETVALTMPLKSGNTSTKMFYWPQVDNRQWSHRAWTVVDSLLTDGQLDRLVPREVSLVSDLAELLRLASHFIDLGPEVELQEPEGT